MREQIVERIVREKIFSVIRLKDTSRIVKIVQAITDGGISIIEITLNSGNALEAIEEVSHKFPQCLVGAGTVIGRRDAENAITAGAKFLVSPHMDAKMIMIAHENDLVAMPGALTPTEIHQGQSAGADFIKIFPLAGIGPSYIKALKGPFPNVSYVATNGVTLDNMQEYFDAGCTAIGLGSVLVSDTDTNVQNIKEKVKRVVAF